jgi:uncharacterized protein YrrD
MLRSTNEMIGYRLLATDGEMGKVHDFYFDDVSWTVRYLVVDTGKWLPGRKVLISPVALDKPDWEYQTLPVNLTTKKIEESPPIETDEPVSRQKQIRIHAYYGWPVYWPYVGGYGGTPAAVAVPEKEVQNEPEEAMEEDLAEGDPHLRSVREIHGYHIGASDGEVGHVEDFIVDASNWVIRYMVVDTRNWLPGRKVLLAPEWADSIVWEEKKVFVGMSRETIKASPEYDSSAPVNREYEEKLYDYYGRPKYWP